MIVWLIESMLATKGNQDLTLTTFRMPSLVLASVCISNQFPSLPEVKKYSASQLSVNSSSKSITWNRSNSELKEFSLILAEYYKGEKQNLRFSVRFRRRGYVYSDWPSSLILRLCIASLPKFLYFTKAIFLEKSAENLTRSQQADTYWIRVATYNNNNNNNYIYIYICKDDSWGVKGLPEIPWTLGSCRWHPSLWCCSDTGLITPLRLGLRRSRWDDSCSLAAFGVRKGNGLTPVPRIRRTTTCFPCVRRAGVPAHAFVEHVHRLLSITESVRGSLRGEDRFSLLGTA